jgi:hypothetical protein
MRRLVLHQDRPTYLGAVAAMLVSQPTFRSEASLMLHLHTRDGPPVLFVVELRCSVSSDGSEVALGAKLTPRTGSSAAASERTESLERDSSSLFLGFQSRSASSSSSSDAGRSSGGAGAGRRFSEMLEARLGRTSPSTVTAERVPDRPTVSRRPRAVVVPAYSPPGLAPPRGSTVKISSHPCSTPVRALKYVHADELVPVM